MGFRDVRPARFLPPPAKWQSDSMSISFNVYLKWLKREDLSSFSRWSKYFRHKNLHRKEYLFLFFLFLLLSNHQSFIVLNDPKTPLSIINYLSVMSIIALIHHHLSLAHFSPSVSLTCQRWWRERSVSHSLHPADQDLALTLWYNWMGKSTHASLSPSQCRMSVVCLICPLKWWLLGTVAISV